MRQERACGLSPRGEDSEIGSILCVFGKKIMIGYIELSIAIPAAHLSIYKTAAFQMSL